MTLFGIWARGLKALLCAALEDLTFEMGTLLRTGLAMKFSGASQDKAMQKSLCSEVDVMRENTFVYTNNTNPSYCSSAGFLC